MCYSALVKRSLKHLEDSIGAIEVRTDFATFEDDSHRDKKRFPPFEDRIFPGHYAPVAYEEGGQRLVSPMRYSAYPPPGVKDKVYTTFNARRDNLTSSFWSTAFGHHHGVVVLEAFYEWVAVKDLLSAKVVPLNAVIDEFDRQIEERRAKVQAAGKNFKLTPTEKTDPRLRKIVIEFRPDDGQDMYAACIFSLSRVGEGKDERWDRGFAIITDDPPPEIRNAGHDRCPIILDRDAIDSWLNVSGQGTAEHLNALKERRRITFQHKLAETA